MKDPRRSARYQRTRALWLAGLGDVGTCCMCGRAIDLKVTGKHPFGPTVEHRIPVRRLVEMAGGDWARLVSLACDTQWWALACRHCQARQGGASSVERTPRPAATPAGTPSRNW